MCLGGFGNIRRPNEVNLTRNEFEKTGIHP